LADVLLNDCGILFKVVDDELVQDIHVENGIDIFTDIGVNNLTYNIDVDDGSLVLSYIVVDDGLDVSFINKQVKVYREIVTDNLVQYLLVDNRGFIHGNVVVDYLIEYIDVDNISIVVLNIVVDNLPDNRFIED